MYKRKETPDYTKGFSLLEVMVALVIGTILMSLATPSFIGITKAFNIATAGQELRNIVAIARQESSSRNRPVEVRLCRLTLNDPVQFVQLVGYETNGKVQILSRTLKLPDHTYIDTDQGRSSLFKNLNSAEDATGTDFTSNRLGGGTLPGAGSKYFVYSFFVRADGTSNLPWKTKEVSGWAPIRYYSVTLRGDKNGEGDPENFAILQIDPANGRATLLRP